MEELLSVNEVASILRVNPTSVRRWIKFGALDAISLPGSGEKQVYRIKRETLEKMLGKLLA